MSPEPPPPRAFTRAHFTLRTRRAPRDRFTGTVTVTESVTVTAPVTIVRRSTTYRGTWRRDAAPAVDARWERRGRGPVSAGARLVARLARPFLAWFDPRFW